MTRSSILVAADFGGVAAKAHTPPWARAGFCECVPVWYPENGHWRGFLGSARPADPEVEEMCHKMALRSPAPREKHFFSWAKRWCIWRESVCLVDWPLFGQSACHLTKEMDYCVQISGAVTGTGLMCVGNQLEVQNCLDSSGSLQGRLVWC